MPSNTSHAYPAFTTVKSGAIKNNGATVLLGGNINTNLRFPAVTQALGATEMGLHSGSNGAIVPGPFTVISAPGHRCTTNAVSGDYAKMTASRYIIMRYTNFIAGTANTKLNSGGADFGGKKPYAAFCGLVRTQKYILTGGWVYQTGQPVNLGFGTDGEGSEAFPTYAAPGRIVYAYTGAKDLSPTTASYKAKTD